MEDPKPGTPAGANPQGDPKPGEKPGDGDKRKFTDDEAAQLLKENMAFKAKLKAQEDAKTKDEEKRLKEQGEFKALSEKNQAKADAATNKLKFAELKAAAIKAGIIDLDLVKLADVSKITVGEDGEVSGVDEVISAMQAAKPHFFGTTQQPPVPKTPIPSHAGSPGGPATLADWEKMPVKERNEWATKNPSAYEAMCEAAKGRRPTI